MAAYQVIILEAPSTSYQRIKRCWCRAYFIVRTVRVRVRGIMDDYSTSTVYDRELSGHPAACWGICV